MIVGDVPPEIIYARITNGAVDLEKVAASTVQIFLGCPPSSPRPGPDRQSKIAVPAIRGRQNYGKLAGGRQPPERPPVSYHEARRYGDFTLK